LSSRRERHLSSRRTSTATTPGSTASTTTTTSLAAEATATVSVAAEVATTTTLALLEVTALAVELLLAVAGASSAALLDPELLLADLEGAGGEGVLVALGGLEVDESAALCLVLVKFLDL
jgi:hypothetical protein